MRNAAVIGLVVVAGVSFLAGCSDRTDPRNGPPAASAPRRVSFVLPLETGDTTPILAAPARADVVDVRINLKGESRFASYEAHLRDGAGEDVWLSDLRRPVQLNASGVLVVSIPAPVLAPGKYELTLLGRTSEGRRVHHADLPFTVR